MLNYNIPGIGKIEIENVVFDYNGTIAVDGKLIDDAKELILKLKEYANIYILTADTYGTVEKECMMLGVNVATFPKEMASISKKEIVEKLGAEKTICVGNGFNDIEMFKICKISIAVIENEGCSGKLLAHSDIVTKSIKDAIDIILSENRMKATLRN
ncbi:HAD family hydrolase [Proteiniborus sp.]|uniref:HAD family hydrolase n=1 Tax=Proteiniborus sp. TaxID=2079015 RepID=UPI00332767CD